MPRKTVVCPECGKPVPSGRLACPACGSLVAAVTGSPRRQTRGARSEGRSRQGNDGMTGAGSASRGPAAGRERVEAAPELTPGAGAMRDERRLDGSGARFDAVDTDEPIGDVDELEVRDWHGPSSGVASAPEHVAPVRPASFPPILQDWPPQPRRGLDDLTGRDLDLPGNPRRADPGNGTTASAPRWPAGAYVPPGPATSTQGASIAGGYLEPSGVFSSVTANGAVAAIAGRSPAATPGPAAATAARVGSPDHPTPDTASLFADLQFDAPSTLTGWLLAVGTGLTTLGFILPWSNVMIGSASSGASYLDAWGLASPTHLVLMLVSLMGLVMAVLPNRVPTWLRTSVFGFVLGGVVVGIVWPYLFEGLGYQVGVIVELIGSLVLIVAGVLSILPARHDLELPSV
jgi:hypothetical protein